ncbi:hypothetical protein FN846DRAFT_894036 [Sphaerosporella brunnea]|uniref:Uncharacterized protein n=1 Tax=Sphaerosporella brunnea TaxID=1250544 RepID=A0A5J5EK67_9PEZI|nr:hypothetical protein FN846DRAFT_894036 [Sphaerosporella brunnea]
MATPGDALAVDREHDETEDPDRENTMGHEYGRAYQGRTPVYATLNRAPSRSLGRDHKPGHVTWDVIIRRITSPGTFRLRLTLATDRCGQNIETSFAEARAAFTKERGAFAKDRAVAAERWVGNERQREREQPAFTENRASCAVMKVRFAKQREQERAGFTEKRAGYKRQM